MPDLERERALTVHVHVKVPSGGSVDMNGDHRFLDVADPSAMKERLDEVGLPDFVRTLGSTTLDGRSTSTTPIT